MKKTLCLFLIINTALLSACASKLNTVSPKDVDLSGDWILNNTYSEEVVLLSQKKRGRARDQDSRGARGQGRAGGGKGKGGDRGGPSQEDGEQQTYRLKKSPSMTAQEMTIKQNSDSMGIAYINELYRDVDWGKTKMWDRTIEAGWNNKGQLVIQTSHEKIDITETYQLNPGGRILTLMIDVNGSEPSGEYRRVFERK